MFLNVQSTLLFFIPSISSSYLQPQSHSLGDGRLGKDGLDSWHQLTGQPSALWTNQIALLLNAGDHGEVEGEVSGDDPTDSLLVQLIVILEVYAQEEEGETRDTEGSMARGELI